MDNLKLPTDKGNKTIPEIMDRLMWGSYKANRGYGCTHEQLTRHGIGNDAMKQRYEQEWIMETMRKLKPDHSIMAHCLYGAAEFYHNFGNVMETILSQYNDSPSGMIHVLGQETMDRILAYHKTYKP